jgi:hypothetical protein
MKQTFWCPAQVRGFAGSHIEETARPIAQKIDYHFGMMRPKRIANMMIVAVVPSAIVALVRCN